MAYATQELKSKVLNLIKTNAKEQKIKIGINARIRHHSTLMVNINSCSIDLEQNLIDTLKATILKFKTEEFKTHYFEIEELEKTLKENQDYDTEHFNYGGLSFKEHNLDYYFSGEALDIVKNAFTAIKCEYVNKSDVMTDYFDISYYWHLTIGNNKDGFQLKA